MASSNMKFLLILFIAVSVIEKAYAPPLPSYLPSVQANRAGKEALIRVYFNQGYAYKNIVLMLTTLHGIKMSLPTLKIILRRMNLKRRKPLTEDMTQEVVAAVRKELEESGQSLSFNE